MRNCFKIASTLLVFISIAGSCSNKIISQNFTNASDTAKQNQTVTVKVDNFQEGKYQMAMHCTGCHAMRLPSQYSKDKWVEILPVMFKKAKMTDENEMQLIREYVFANMNSK